MSLVHEVESFLIELRPAFSRKATFRWFITSVWAFLLCFEFQGVTSFVRCFALPPNTYPLLLNFFHSKAMNLELIVRLWREIVFKKAPLVKLAGLPIVPVDGIKIPKEGRRMPLVKWLHQESSNNTKPTYISGHYFNAVGVLASAANQTFSIPLTLEIHDGLKLFDDDNPSIVSKMAALVVGTLDDPAYVIGDAYYSAAPMINVLREAGHHYIGKCPSNSVAFRPLPTVVEGERKRGRPRKYGEKIVLSTLFKSPELFKQVSIDVHGQIKTYSYYHIDLLRRNIPEPVRLLLSIDADGNHAILLCTDLNLDPEKILWAYALRFKIEVAFKSLIQRVGAFAYHFWSRDMPKRKQKDGDILYPEVSDKLKEAIARKTAAYHRFVHCSAIALGCLQLLSLRHSEKIWKTFPLWFRTRPKSHNLPSPQVVRFTLQHEVNSIFDKSCDSLYLQKILHDLHPDTSDPHSMQFVQRAA